MPAPELEHKLAEGLVKKYPKMNTENPTSFVLLNEDGDEVYKSGLIVCHSYMSYCGKMNTYDIMLNAIPYDDKLYLDFVQALIDGPFRNWSDQISIVPFDDKWSYLKITGLDKFPANALYNFVIAVRYPFENNENSGKHYDSHKEGHDRVKRIRQMVDAGVPLMLAFLIGSLYLNETAEDPWDWTITNPIFNGYNSNHHYLDNSSDWGLVLSGKPTKLNDPYKTNRSGCRPCNVIWGHNPGNQSFTGKSVREMYNLFKHLLVSESIDEDLIA